MDAFVRLANGLLMMALPVVLGLILASRWKARWSTFAAGALTFVLSQLGHLPFNQFLLTPLALRQGWVTTAGQLTLLGAVLFGLSAGVFEETARYLVLRFWKKDVRSWTGGMMLGAGHGGIEALVLGGLALLAFAQAMAARGAPDLSQLVPADQVAQLQAALDSYWGLPWYAALLGAGERVLAIALHLSLSLMVLQVFRSGRLSWLGLAVAWHALADALIVYIAGVVGPYAAEGALAILTLGSLFWIVYLRRTQADPEAAPEEPLHLSALQKVDHDLNQTDLEQSRYQ